MSLGSSAGFQKEDDPEQIAVKKAVDAGVVVVVAEIHNIQRLHTRFQI